MQPSGFALREPNASGGVEVSIDGCRGAVLLRLRIRGGPKAQQACAPTRACRAGWLELQLLLQRQQRREKVAALPVARDYIRGRKAEGIGVSFLPQLLQFGPRQRSGDLRL